MRLQRGVRLRTVRSWTYRDSLRRPASLTTGVGPREVGAAILQRGATLNLSEVVNLDNKVAPPARLTHAIQPTPMRVIWSPTPR